MALAAVPLAAVLSVLACIYFVVDALPKHEVHSAWIEVVCIVLVIALVQYISVLSFTFLDRMLMEQPFESTHGISNQ